MMLDKRPVRRRKHRHFLAGREVGKLELVVDLAEDTDHALRADERCGIVNRVAMQRALGEAELNEHAVAARELADPLRRWPGNGLRLAEVILLLLGAFLRSHGQREVRIPLEPRFGQDENVDAMPRRLFDQFDEALEIASLVMDDLDVGSSQSGLSHVYISAARGNSTPYQS